MYTDQLFLFNPVKRYLFTSLRHRETSFYCTVVHPATSPCPFPSCVSPRLTCSQCKSRRLIRQKLAGSLYKSMYESRKRSISFSNISVFDEL